MTPPRLGYVVRGDSGKHPGSAHVRVVRRVDHAMRVGTVVGDQVDPARILDGSDPGPYVSIVIQRDSLGAGDAREFAAAARRVTSRLVLELDDDLFSEAATARLLSGGYDDTALASMRDLIDLVDVIIVSTPVLADLLRHRGDRVVVIPNALDPTLWSKEPAEPPEPVGPPHRLLYMGSATHDGDLEMLREPLARLAARSDRAVELDVIGVTDGDGSWYSRLDIPEHWNNYPQFVRWLRGLDRRWIAGVAPLTSEAFNRAKSDLKFLEYSMLGLPTLASRSPVYDGIDRHGGILVRDSAHAWQRAIIRVAAHPERARARARAAGAYVARERMLTVGDAWITAVLGDDL